jgi:hypothetical protein
MKFRQLFNVFKKLRSAGTAKAALKTPLHPHTQLTKADAPPVSPNRTPAATPIKRVKFSKEFVQNHSPLDFNLTEALKLRAEGWSNGRIARKMNNVSVWTVRRRLMAYDAAQMPKPAPAAEAPQQAEDNKKVAETKPIHNQNTIETKPVPVTVPLPVTNLAELRNQPDTTNVFIVRPESVKYGLGSEQPCIGFDIWHDEYRLLDMFQKPSKFWILVNAEDGSAVNRRWLESIAADIWLYERCSVLRIEHGGVLSVLQARYDTQHRYPWQSCGSKLADEIFETVFNFVQCPQPNHHELLAALTKDATNTTVPIMDNQEWGAGWSANEPLPPRARYDDRPRNNEGAGGLVGMDDGTNYGK